MQKPKRGCFGRILRWAVIGIVLLFGLGVVAQIVNPSTPTPRPAVVNVINTAVPSGTPAPTDPPTATDKPTTPTITPSPRPSFTPDMTKTLAPTASAFSEADYIEKLRPAFDSTGLDIHSVRVADGRAKGGTRSIILTYVSNATQTKEWPSEWAKLFGAAVGAIETNKLDADELMIIIGLPNGDATASVAVQVDDLLAYRRNEIDTEELFKRLHITDF